MILEHLMEETDKRRDRRAAARAAAARGEAALEDDVRTDAAGATGEVADLEGSEHSRPHPWSVFIELQRHYLEELNACLTSREHAKRLLLNFTTHMHAHSGYDGGDGDGSGDDGGGAAGGAIRVALALVEAGVPLGEPFLASIMAALRRSLMADVLDKGRVRLDQAASLIGVIDEEGILEYGEVFVQTVPPWADELAGRHIHEGDLVVSRSPCHQAGDVRVLRAVVRVTEPTPVTARSGL